MLDLDEWEDDSGLAECERYEYELDRIDLLLRDDPFYPIWLELVEMENKHVH